MTNSPTTSQEDEIRLKETLEDAIDGRRFDHNFPKLNFSDIERVIQYILPTVQAEIATATNRARIDERILVKDEMLKYFRKELTGFRKETRNAPGLNQGELQVLTMLLNRIDARYAVLRFRNHERIAQLSKQEEVE